MEKALILLLLLTGCAGTKLNVGAKYDVLDNEIGATSQFFPSAEASIKQDDVYGVFFWFEFPIGDEPLQRMTLENAHELKDPIILSPSDNPDSSKSDTEVITEAIGSWDTPTLVLVGLFAIVVLSVVGGGVLKKKRGSASP